MITLLQRFFLHADKLAAVWALAIAYLSLTPLPELPAMPSSDKVLHFSAYALLSFLALATRGTLRSFAAMALAILVYGGVIEILQPYVNRYMETGDFIANTLGTLGGAMLAYGLRRYHVAGN